MYHPLPQSPALRTVPTAQGARRGLRMSPRSSRENGRLGQGRRDNIFDQLYSDRDIYSNRIDRV